MSTSFGQTKSEVQAEKIDTLIEGKQTWSLKTLLNMANFFQGGLKRKADRGVYKPHKAPVKFIIRKKPPKKFVKKHKITSFEIMDHNIYTFQPEEMTQPDKAILFLHGGAYVFEAFMVHWPIASHLTNELGMKLYFSDYPVPPDYNYKDVLKHTLLVYQEMLKSYKAENIIVMGDSSGGGLAASLSIVLSEMNLPQPGNLVLYYPWVDVSLSNPDIDVIQKKDKLLYHPFIQLCGVSYAGEDQLKNPLISTVYSDLSELPRTIIFQGNHDILYPDARKFYEKALEQGRDISFVEFDQMPHAWLTLSRKSTQTMFDILKPYLLE